MSFVRLVVLSTFVCCPEASCISVFMCSFYWEHIFYYSSNFRRAITTGWLEQRNRVLF